MDLPPPVLAPLPGFLPVGVELHAAVLRELVVERGVGLVPGAGRDGVRLVPVGRYIGGI